jgi:hypothetical protein
MAVATRSWDMNPASPSLSKIRGNAASPWGPPSYQVDLLAILL